MAVIRASIICINDNEILGFYGKEPGTNKLFFFLPGGKLEKDESPVKCAVRETLEETGFHISIDETTEEIVSYSLEWDGQQFPCSTHFYVAKLRNAKKTQVVNDAEYHQGICWLPLNKLNEELSYNKKLQQFVIEFIAKHSS